MTRLALTLAVLSAGLLSGCAEQQGQPDSMDRRQSEALRDPFSYGPTTPTAGAPNRPGPGGVAGDPNVNKTQRDDSLKADWNRFWNP